MYSSNDNFLVIFQEDSSIFIHPTDLGDLSTLEQFCDIFFSSLSGSSLSSVLVNNAGSLGPLNQIKVIGRKIRREKIEMDTNQTKPNQQS